MVSSQETIKLEAEKAFTKGDYFEAVYKFRSALSYHPVDTLLYERLRLAYEGSCTDGNEQHCDKGLFITRKIKFIKQFGVADTAKNNTGSRDVFIKPTNKLVFE